MVLCWLWFHTWVAVGASNIDAEGECHVKVEMGHRWQPLARKRQGGIVPRAFREGPWMVQSMPPLILVFWFSELWENEFLLLKPPSLWCLNIAALGYLYTQNVLNSNNQMRSLFGLQNHSGFFCVKYTLGRKDKGSISPNQLPMGWNFAGVQGWHCTRCLQEICYSESRQVDVFLGGQAPGAEPFWNGEMGAMMLTYTWSFKDLLSALTSSAPWHMQSRWHPTLEFPPSASCCW